MISLLSLFVWLLFVANTTSYDQETLLIERIGVGSCNNPNRQDIWNIIEKQSPTRLILLGDIIYADNVNLKNTSSSYDSTVSSSLMYDKVVKCMRYILSFDVKSFLSHMLSILRPRPATVDVIRDEYSKLLACKSFASLLSSLPSRWNSVDAVYDDHDLGVNNGDKTYPHMRESQQLFWDFINEPTSSNRRLNDGVYSSRLVNKSDFNFTYKIILLDTRSMKDPTVLLPSDNNSFLGNKQWVWLEEELRKSYSEEGVDLILIGSSIQVLPTEKIVEETWNAFPLQRERLLRLLHRTKRYTNVIILSGDIHSAEISQAYCSEDVTGNDGEYMYELTSSGLTHTFSYYTEKRYTNDIVPTPPVVYNKGLIYNIVGSIYQFFLPHYYREHTHKDYYDNIHFSLLDIRVDALTSAYSLNYKVIDIDSNIVVSKSIALHMKRFSHIDSSTIEDKITAVSATNGGSICKPYHGIVPLWKLLLLRLSLVAVSFSVFVSPILVCMWLIVAAIYYILYGYEKARRQMIQDRYYDSIKKVT